MPRSRRDQAFPIRFLCVLILLLLVFASAACGQTDPPSGESASGTEPVSEPVSEPASEAVSETSPDESEESAMTPTTSDDRIPPPTGNTKTFTNLDYKNTGKMGDNDGPAYCVYSKTGYRKASMDVQISQMQIHTVRKSDRKFVNAYMFLGCDIYSGSWWANCFDAGFCWSGGNPAWHLFYNIYDPADGQKGWYESSVRLNSKHDYRLTLDTSEEDEKATVVIYDLTAEKEADRAVFYVKKMKRDGSNTSYLMDFALDYPDNVRKDRNGKTTQDWAEITLYNTDEGLFLNNVLVTNTMILPGTSDEMVPWDGNATNNRSLWPDRTVEIFDYPCTTVYVDENEPDSSFRVDLDMNHRS